MTFSTSNCGETAMSLPAMFATKASYAICRKSKNGIRFTHHVKPSSFNNPLNDIPIYMYYRTRYDEKAITQRYKSVRA
ncbi:hypothetical protein [Winogradskyella arenosi]|uniref:Uncharacterized protein n=1 Tax=Winogradskyella arenosi TaxID=533325 RepID=A0A368ZK21_9FLAO|nr:hypothetical protein [Winogradskyella arenosi]RCW93778.1 hypothetical protein DFQ08_101576 [Winogradskyella arenosi]